MLKIIVSVVLVAVAAYCTMIIYHTKQWSDLLAQKQETFGIFRTSRLDFGAMKTIRNVCLTSLALVVFLPGDLGLPFQGGTANDESMNINSTKGVQEYSGTVGKETQKSAPAPMIVGEAPQSGLSTTGVPDVVDSNELNGDETKKDGAYDADRYSFFSMMPTADQQWNSAYQDQKLIVTMYIENYTDDMPLNEVSAKELLAKTPVQVDDTLFEENYRIKMVFQDGHTFAFGLAYHGKHYYLLDDTYAIMYRLGE